jgi:predicted kinase
MGEYFLILMVGLPRSGKSTWAKRQGFPIVNRDAIRLAVHGWAYIQRAEAIITPIEEYMVKALFLAGHDKVIVDATHTTEERRKRWEELGYDVHLQIMKLDKEYCIDRAKRDRREDLIPVIERMAEKIEYESEFPDYAEDDSD